LDAGPVPADAGRYSRRSSLSPAHSRCLEPGHDIKQLLGARLLPPAAKLCLLLLDVALGGLLDASQLACPFTSLIDTRRAASSTDEPAWGVT